MIHCAQTLVVLFPDTLDLVLQAYLVLNLVAKEKEYKAHPVDIINKPFYMMKLNPGKCWVFYCSAALS